MDRNSRNLSANALELLAPAKDKYQGMEAIRHGADAVYIGAPAFGARASVPVSAEDIKELIDFAHLYQARVYVALNTILRDDELPRAVELAHQMYEIGADALIVQDIGLLTQELPPIALHASTQMDNVSAERVAFWSEQGFEQVVLARELSPAQISRIHAKVPDVRLECFVHGALCVSYSGRCYAAAAFHTRSANRGSCSQVCRLPFNLYDGEGNLLVKNKHLLSIKDLNRSEFLGELIEAGVRSFKIEGRLKDVSYVKNVTLAYSRALNDYISTHPEYSRSSLGEVRASFTPDLSKVFNRGFTSFTHKGRGEDDLASFTTPKSIGPEIGKIKSISGTQLTLELLPNVVLANGDGFTFVDRDGTVQGFRANTADGNLVTLSKTVHQLKAGITLHRSHDLQFEKLMQNDTSERKLKVDWMLGYSNHLLTLSSRVKGMEKVVEIKREIELEKSQKGDSLESIKGVLNKLGNTPYESSEIIVDIETQLLFIPRSILTQMRQEAVEELNDTLRQQCLATRGHRETTSSSESFPYWTQEVNYTSNILNSSAKKFLERRGVTVKEMAYEHTAQKNQPVMYTKHCIRYCLHQCPHLQGYKQPHKDPWVLVSTLPDDPNPVKMSIEFDCPNCQMKLTEEP